MGQKETWGEKLWVSSGWESGVPIHAHEGPVVTTPRKWSWDDVSGRPGPIYRLFSSWHFSQGKSVFKELNIGTSREMLHVLVAHNWQKYREWWLEDAISIGNMFQSQAQVVARGIGVNAGPCTFCTWAG